MRVAVVTGVARKAGIGHAVCQRLLSDGLSVIGIDNQPLDKASPLSLLQEEERNNTTTRFSFCRASVTDHQAVAAALKSGLAALSSKSSSSSSGQKQRMSFTATISVVVNNAGIPQPFLQTISPAGASSSIHGEDHAEEANQRLAKRLEEFDNYLQTNLRSAFLVTEACRPYFDNDSNDSPTGKEGGTGGVSVIQISSTRAHQSPHRNSVECPNGQEGYSAAKAGLLGLMHSQGQALGPNCRVNVISPGWIDTTTDTDYTPTKEDHDCHAVGRVGKPEDVAAMVSFLADHRQSGFLTCQEIVLDGGVSRAMTYPE